MKKSIVPILALGVFFLGLVFAWHSLLAASRNKDYGPVVSKDVGGLGDFSSVVASGIVDVVFVQSEVTLVRVSAPLQIIDKHLNIGTAKGVLTLATKGNLRFRGPVDITIYVSAPHIHGISTGGTGDVRISGKLDVPALELETAGTGDIEADAIKCERFVARTKGTGDIEVRALEAAVGVVVSSGTGDVEIAGIEAGSFSATVNGTGDIDLKGSARRATYSVNGSGGIDAGGLKTQTVKADANGTGSIKYYNPGSAGASAAGVGGTTYGGNPATAVRPGHDNRTGHAR